MWVTDAIARYILGPKMQMLEVALDKAKATEKDLRRRLKIFGQRIEELESKDRELRSKFYEEERELEGHRKLAESYKRHDEIVRDLKITVDDLERENHLLTIELGKVNRRIQRIEEGRQNGKQ